MFKWIKGLFEHKCRFEQIDAVFHSSKKIPLSANPVTAKVFRCRCGREARVLTAAGQQQVFAWGDDLRECLGVDKSTVLPAGKT